jgi:hypothetical protein
MNRCVCAALAALVVVSFAVPALAQDPGAKFAMHIQAHAQKTALVCTSESPNDTTTGAATACSDYVVDYPTLLGGDMYVVIAQADSDGVSATSFGIEYDDENTVGVDVGGFVPCISGLPFFSDDPKWPASGSGARFTWLLPNDCQSQVIEPDGVHAVVGAFYVYAYSTDTFLLTPNRTLLSGPELAIATCNAGNEHQFDTDNVTRAAWVSFGETVAPGCNPCLAFCATPVEQSTWGKIKSRYTRN